MISPHACLLGSGDLYDLRGRRPTVETLTLLLPMTASRERSVVSYNDKHNEANGEIV